MEEEEFFKQYELEMEMLPQGIEDLGVKIALPKMLIRFVGSLWFLINLK